MQSQRIIVDSKTFWKIFTKIDGFVLSTGSKEEKGYLNGIPIYIKNI